MVISSKPAESCDSVSNGEEYENSYSDDSDVSMSPENERSACMSAGPGAVSPEPGPGPQLHSSPRLLCHSCTLNMFPRASFVLQTHCEKTLKTYTKYKVNLQNVIVSVLRDIEISDLILTQQIRKTSTVKYTDNKLQYLDIFKQRTCHADT